MGEYHGAAESKEESTVDKQKTIITILGLLIIWVGAITMLNGQPFPGLVVATLGIVLFSLGMFIRRKP
jgi:hypothetical protein